ncbi:MAG: sporulation protein [Candidatus Thorarchaeota archaeon]|nr:sporulation protein [Candidatus Thorarchaeota archaeon]
MREVQVLLNKNVFVPGETIEGTMTVTTDKEFKCNKVVMTIVAELTAITTYTDKHHHTRQNKKTRKILEDHIVLAKKTTIAEGTTSFDFKYTLPSNALPSCSVFLGGVTYYAKGNVDVSWSIDPSDKTKFTVLPVLQKMKPQTQTETVKLKGGAEIIFEIPNDVLTPRQPIIVRTRIMGDPSIRGIRYKLIGYQRSKISLSKERNDLILAENEVPVEDLIGGQMSEIVFSLDDDYPIQLDTNALKLWYGIKITVDIPRRLDKTVEIPLIVGIPAVDTDMM